VIFRSEPAILGDQIAVAPRFLNLGLHGLLHPQPQGAVFDAEVSS
jgi:hypothetical protein